MPEDTRVSFWNIVNKPIFIWFLATVVVGLVSFGYDYVQNERKIKQIERQIDLEIASRLMHARIFYFPEAYAVGLVAAWPEDEGEPDDVILKEAYGGFRMFRQALDAGTSYGAFPEFRERSLQSLVWELSSLRENSPTGPLKEALHAAIAISRQRIFWMNPENFEPGVGAVTGESAGQAVRTEFNEFERNYEKLRLGRWDFELPEETLLRYTPNLSVPELGE